MNKDLIQGLSKSIDQKCASLSSLILPVHHKNELPFYEIISGAAIAFAALLLIIPGFATDILGVLLIFPYTRKLIFYKYSKKHKQTKNLKDKDFIEGEYEDMDDKKWVINIKLY